jgi:T5SS/PEP-CTERM-associated repeat protein
VLSGNHIVQGDPSQGVFTANYYHYDEGSQTWSLLAEHLNAFSVSLSGDVSVTGGHPNFPTARVRWFDEKKDSWGPGQGIELAASDGLDVKFGSSVAVDGDFCAVADEANKEPTSPGAVYVYFLADCNSNGIPDSVDILDGTSLDLDGTGVPDECEDCDGDGIPNVEEIEMGSIDCDDDQIPDECEDPDGNGINDECDCNDNDVLDGEDIENGTSLDCNLNGVPDECEDFFAGEARWLGESDLQPDGLFRLHTNWDPDFPGADGSAMFDLGFDGAYTVFFDKDASNVAATVRSDEVVFNLGGFSYELTDAQDHSLIIALDAGDQASLTLLSGVLISREARIGNGEGAVGAVIVDGPGTVWSQPMLTDELCVGCSGTGSLIVSNGATVDSGIAVVGLESSSAADVLITGADSIWQVGLPLIVDNGTLAVEDGGTIHVGLGDLVILDDAMLVGDGNVEVPNGRVINLGGMHPTQMLMDGDFRQCPDGDEPDLGVLFVDITAGGHDHLTVTGSADVCGGLVVDLIGFEPEIGATFPFLQAGSTSGVFDVALFDGLSDERFLTLAYPLGPGGEISIVVETLASLFGFGEVIHPEDLAGVPTDIAIADLDDDGDQDVAVTIPVGRGEAGAVLVLENGGTVDGVWQGWAKSHAFTVGELPTAIVAAPLDGDDLIDLAVTNGADHDVSILLNAGAGIGFDIIEYASNGTGPAALAVEAFDATTGLDLAIVHAGDDTLTVLINQGDGSFAAGRTLSLPAGSLASAVDPADVDNDKCTDVVAALSGLDQVAVLQGDGAGGFTLGPDGLMDVGAEPVQLVVTDLDGDGADDVVTANAGNGTISVLASNPAGLLDPAVDLPIGESSSWIAAFDAEGDGDDDLAVVTDDADLGRLVRVIRNDSMPEQLALTVLPDDQAVGQEPVLVAGGQIDGLPGDDLVSITTASGAGPGMFPQAQVQPALPEMIVICPADVTGDMNVDVQDLVEVVLAWGPCPAPCTPDVNDDGVVDVQDLVEIVLAWGPCSP